MLPFMFLSRLILREGGANLFAFPVRKLLKKVFNLDGAFTLPLVTGVLSGYPVTATLTGRLLNDKLITLPQAKLFISFALTVSPIFVLGTIPVICDSSRLHAYIIYISHLIGCFLTGLIIASFFKKSHFTPALSTLPINKSDIGTILCECILNCLAVGGYIALFFMLSEMITIIPLTNELSVFIKGALEMTNGAISASRVFSPKTATIIICGFVSFGGLCVNMQCFSFLAPHGFKLSYLIGVKLLNALLSVIVCFILLTFVPF